MREKTLSQSNIRLPNELLDKLQDLLTEGGRLNRLNDEPKLTKEKFFEIMLENLFEKEPTSWHFSGVERFKDFIKGGEK